MPRERSRGLQQSKSYNLRYEDTFLEPELPIDHEQFRVLERKCDNEERIITISSCQRTRYGFFDNQMLFFRELKVPRLELSYRDFRQDTLKNLKNKDPEKNGKNQTKLPNYRNRHQQVGATSFSLKTTFSERHFPQTLINQSKPGMSVTSRFRN